MEGRGKEGGTIVALSQVVPSVCCCSICLHVLLASLNFIQLPFHSICTSSDSLLIEWRMKKVIICFGSQSSPVNGQFRCDRRAFACKQYGTYFIGCGSPVQLEIYPGRREGCLPASNMVLTSLICLAAQPSWK